jgi:hypothetical protein
MVRGISMERTCSKAGVTVIVNESDAAGGITKATGVTAGLSTSWQQDIEQFIMPLEPWSQSSPAAEFVGAF